MMTVDAIKEKFITCASEHGRAHRDGDYKKANRLHRKLHDLYNLVKSQNMLDVFSELLTNSDESVRAWAATFSLKAFPILAEESLSELAQLPSLTGLDAEMTLRLWKDDKLDLL